MTYHCGDREGKISFSTDGKFVNDFNKLEGKWLIEPANADGINETPLLKIFYPSQNIEAEFEATLLKDFPFKGGVSLKCSKSTGEFLFGHEIKSLSSERIVTAELKNYKEDNMALVLHGRQEHHFGHDARWLKIGPKENSIRWVLEERGENCFLMDADRRDQAFEISFGRHDPGTDILFFGHRHDENHQLWRLHGDGTISTNHRHDLVLGWNEDEQNESTRLKLVPRGDKYQLFFANIN